MTDDELDDLSHSAIDELLGCGLDRHTLLRYFKTIRNRATPAPAQPEPKGTSPTDKVTTPGQSHQPEPMGEPVAWEIAVSDVLPDGELTKSRERADLAKRLGYGVEPLFRHPPAASTPAAPDAPTTPSESEAYMAGFADCAAGRAAAPVEGAAWQDIETAPKDCTEILAWVKEVGGAMVLMYFSSLKRWGDGITNDSWTPTHWMPLPSPPVAPKEKPHG